MRYAIVDNNMVITNIIECEDQKTANEFNAFPVADNLEIGNRYAPPMTKLDKLEAQTTYTAMMTNTLLKED